MINILLNTIVYKGILVGAGIFGLCLLVVFHELGHFLFCKLFNIHTPSFSVGFGPTIFARKIGTTLFKLSLIPLGGYVEIAGNAEVGQGEQEYAEADDEKSFISKPFWQKLCVMFGGILFNLIFSYTVFILVFWLGAPKTQLLYPTIAIPIVEQILPNSPAAQADLHEGDHIRRIDLIDSKNLYSTDLTNTIRPIIALQEALVDTNDLEASLQLTIDRAGVSKTIIIKPEFKEIRNRIVAFLGITFMMEENFKVPFVQAISYGIAETHRWIKNIGSDFLHLFKKRNVGEMAGPLMIIAMSSKWAGEGIVLFFIFLALISINLALLNLIPIPILDGGQILFCIIEAIIRRPLPEKIRIGIHIVCWVLFLILFAFLSWQDFMRIAEPWISKIQNLITKA